MKLVKVKKVASSLSLDLLSSDAATADCLLRRRMIERGSTCLAVGAKMHV